MGLVDGPQRALLLASFLSLSALSIAPPGSSQELDLEDPLVVSEIHFDASFPFASGDGPDEFVYVDENNDGRFGGDEAVYLTVGGDQVDLWDVRVGQPPVEELGSQVHPGDADRNGTVDRLRGTIRFFDEDSNGAFGPGDTLVFDTNDGQRGELDANDLILSGAQAGTRAGAGHTFVGSGLTSWSGQIVWSDVNPDGAYGQGDLLFLDTGTHDRLSVRDVRLHSRGFGSVVTVGASDAVYQLEDSAGPDELIYVDGDGDGRFDLEEPAYLSTSRNTVVGGSLRIGNTGDHEAGSAVRGGHSDFGKAAQRLDADVAFLDVDGSGGLSVGDVLYVDQDDDQDGTVSVRDIVLTGPQAGDVVDSSHSALGAGLTAFDGQITYVDADGGESYSSGEPVFFDAASDDVLDPEDLGLGGLAPQLVSAVYRPGLLRTLQPLPVTGAFAFTDSDGDEAYATGEALYYTLQGTNEAHAGDLRVASPPGDHSIGSQVVQGDKDHGAGLVEQDGRLAYRDLDQNQRLAPGDPVYLDADRSGTLTLDDVALTTPRAGLPVLDDDPALGSPLTLYLGVPSYFDADGSVSYSVVDLFYFDMNEDGLVTPLDIGYRSPLPDMTLDELVGQPNPEASQDEEPNGDEDREEEPEPDPPEDKPLPPNTTGDEPEEPREDDSTDASNGSDGAGEPEERREARERSIPIQAMGMLLAFTVAALWSKRA